MDARLERFLDHFNRLSKDTLHLLDEMYADDVLFVDPIREVRGLSSLKVYFARMYQNTLSVRFEWESRLMLGAEASVAWRMALRHKYLENRNEFWVSGMTHLRFSSASGGGSSLGGRVIVQRDYFDLGGLVYERIPGMGRVIKAMKSYI